MPQFRVNVTVQQKGMIFDAGQTRAAAARMTTEVNEILAQEGVQRVKARLGQVLQNPTGYYESRIEVLRGERYRGVWDNRVAYGGWLEGVDPRNSGRFKGYRTFRLVRQSLADDKASLAAPIVNKFVREMNGR